MTSQANGREPGQPPGFVERVVGRVTRTVVPRRYMVGTRGKGVRISQSTRIAGGSQIAIEDRVTIAGLCWILVPGWENRTQSGPAIRIGRGTSIGESCTISSVNHVSIGPNVLFGPRVWVTDHNHVYEDTNIPIQEQGWTAGGSVDIEENCWLGTGAVIIGAKPLRIGRGSVVGANSVVTSDVPAHTVVAGNPARIVRRYDSVTASWGSGPNGHD